MRRFIGLLVLAIVLAGCSTSQTSEADVLVAKPENLYAYQEKTVENNSTIIVTRDSGLIGVGGAFAFYLNGKLVARLYRQERAVFYVPSGEFLLGYGSVGGLVKDGPRIERETILKAGETKRFRLFIDQDGNMDIRPSS